MRGAVLPGLRGAKSVAIEQAKLLGQLIMTEALCQILHWAALGAGHTQKHTWYHGTRAGQAGNMAAGWASPRTISWGRS